MTRRDKLIEDFNSLPVDFRWEDLVKVMESLEYDLDSGGGGSHVHFISKVDKHSIMVVKPHGNNKTVAKWDMKKIKQALTERGLL